MEVKESVKVSLFTLDWLRKQFFMEWFEGKDMYFVLNAIFEKEVYGFEPDTEEWSEEATVLYERYLDDNGYEK